MNGSDSLTYVVKKLKTNILNTLIIEYIQSLEIELRINKFYKGVY